MSNKFHKAVLPVLIVAAAALPAIADDEAFEKVNGIKRLEQRTPAGMVPAVPASATPAPALAEEQPSIAEAKFDDGEPAARDQEIIGAFRKAYTKAGAPRLAIYFNRELSDEVREWVPGNHVQTDVQVHQTISRLSMTDQVSGQATTEAKADVRSRRYVGATGGREDPREAWKWEFEDAITSLFLEGNANIVDRAVMFRQTAKQAPQTAGMDGTISTTLNEMSALEKFADVLLEMKVTRSASALGYDFRASARNIKTGRILGSAFVNGSTNKQQLAKPRYVPTSKGYERQEAVTDLTVEQVSRELTLKLMQSLTLQLGH